jgi:hypothetical protein
MRKQHIQVIIIVQIAVQHVYNQQHQYKEHIVVVHDHEHVQDVEMESIQQRQQQQAVVIVQQEVIVQVER